MAISDAQFAAWLLQNTPRVALAEIDYVAEVSGAPATQTLYFSTAPNYVSAATDTPASTPYQDRILQLPTYTRQLDRQTLGGQYSIGFGQLTLANADGGLDAILGYAYDGSAVRFYVGDPSWAKADFRLVFVAVGASVTVPDFSTVQFTIKDASALLNRAFDSGVQVGGSGANAAVMRPVPLGRVGNVAPVLADATALKYVHADVATNTSIIAVRDRGVSLAGGWTDDGDGTFTLKANPQGQITADVLRLAEGSKSDSWRLSDAFGELVGGYGGLTALGQYASPHASFTVGDAEDFHCGQWITDNSAIADLATALATSGNCFWAANRSNQVYLGRIRAANPPGAPVLSLTEDDLVDQAGIKIEETIPLYSQVQALGNKNWSPQTDLGTSLAADVADSYRRNGYVYLQPAPSGTSYAANPALYHKTMAKSPLFETLIARESDAAAAVELATWCDARRKQTASWAQLVDIQCHFRAYQLDLGDVVTLTLPRFGFAAGINAQVIASALDLDKLTVSLTLAYRLAATAQSGALPTPGYLLQQNGSRLIIAAIASPTLDPSKTGAGASLTANLFTLSAGSAGARGSLSSISATTGMYYFECACDAPNVGAISPRIGICLDNGTYDSFGGTNLGSPNPQGVAMYPRGAPYGQMLMAIPNGDLFPLGGALPSIGDVLMCAVDCAAKKIWFGMNGVWLGGGNPASGASPAYSGWSFSPAYAALWVASGQATMRFASNTWSYAAPSGYTQWGGAAQAALGDLRIAA